MGYHRCLSKASGTLSTWGGEGEIRSEMLTRQKMFTYVKKKTHRIWYFSDLMIERKLTKTCRLGTNVFQASKKARRVNGRRRKKKVSQLVFLTCQSRMRICRKIPTPTTIFGDIYPRP